MSHSDAARFPNDRVHSAPSRSRVLVAAAVGLLASCISIEKPAPAHTGDPAVNTVERRYGKPLDTVWDAAVAAVKSLDLRIDTDRHDELGGELVARRADGHRISIALSAGDKDVTRAAIRVEPGNRELAGLVHERLADKLGMGEAKAAFLGGNTVEDVYSVDFPHALAAADRSAKALKFIVTGQETRDDAAQLDARTPDSTPVRFRMTLAGTPAGATRVTFIAGHGKTDMSKTLIAQMKAEFDRQAASEGR
ncbi:MAG TPA: DUF3568 family protein [Planctomycetota bacterium]|nr:DUF3568 family protein [Planctomycetota bacterium]